MAKQKVSGSELFSVEQRGEGNNSIYTELSGDKFKAHNIIEQELPFYNDLLGNPEVMKLFGDGKPKTAEHVRARFETWNKRFSSMQPHGALTVSDTNDNAVGFIVPGAGGENGVSEIAYAFVPEVQGHGIGTSVLKSVVETWAEEVNGIGVGKIADVRFPQLQDAFKCFGGDALRRFDATYSPLNIASGRILGKAGFVMAQSGLCSDNTFDLTNTDLSFAKVEDAEKIAEQFFDGREKNKRYTCVDQEGVEHTLSFKEDFNSFRFHVERAVGVSL